MTTLDQAAVALPAILTDPRFPKLPDVLIRARGAIEAVAADALSVPDSAIEKPWLWNGHDHGDGVRYGLYRAAETVELAHAELEAALAELPARPAGAIRSAPATIARWALQGRLVSLDDDSLDRVPMDGEWAPREVLAHTIAGQRSYGWFSRWWLSQPLGSGRPARVTEEAEAQSERELPSDGAEGVGTVAEIRARLDAVLDEWALRYASLDAAALAVPATWAGVPVDIDFRIGRWASHIREHTIQLDKTLDWLGYQAPESARIVRQLFSTWGRLEAAIFPAAPSGSDAAVTSILDRLVDTLATESADVRAAAER